MSEQISSQPRDHAKRARVFLDNIHDRMRGGVGPELRTPQQKDLMATEALAHAVLALDETLNRIFPAEPEIPDLTGQDVLDGDLPGMWSHSDFEYGATDAAEDEARLRGKHFTVIDMERKHWPSLMPAGIAPDHWFQVVSATVTARATGSVGAKVPIQDDSRGETIYSIVFRKTVSDDQWKITSTTSVADIYVARGSTDQ